MTEQNDAAGQDAAAAEAAAAAAAAAQPQPKWHEDARWTEHRDWLTAKGGLSDDPLDALEKAVKAAHGAEKFLGRKPETLMTRPAEGQALAEWMRANAAVFGLPDAPDKYAIEKPELAEGVEWDETLEAAARKVAYENGVAPAALQAMVGLYAQHLGERVQGLRNESDAAEAEVRTQLEREWGVQTKAKIAQAQIAAKHLAEKAGLGAEGQNMMMAQLGDSMGHVFAVKAMAALADMMGEDMLALPHGGGGGFASTPAEAMAKLNAMNAPDSPYAKAVAAGDRATVERLTPERNMLIRLASAGM